MNSGEVINPAPRSKAERNGDAPVRSEASSPSLARDGALGGGAPVRSGSEGFSPSTPSDGVELEQTAIPASYWPSFAIKDAVVATSVTILVVLLAVFVVPRQVVTDPIYRTWEPSPDWLYLFYFLPYMYLRGNWQLPALLSIPPMIVFLLILVPFVQRDEPKTARRRRWRKILVVGLSVLVVGGLFSATVYTGGRVPAQGCEACHRPRMVGTPPTEVKAFGHRDSQWIAKHLVDPQYWWLQ